MDRQLYREDQYRSFGAVMPIESLDEEPQRRELEGMPKSPEAAVT